MVKVKLLQGGGLSPLSSGDDQTPGSGVGQFTMLHQLCMMVSYASE